MIFRFFWLFNLFELFSHFLFGLWAWAILKLTYLIAIILRVFIVCEHDILHVFMFIIFQEVLNHPRHPLFLPYPCLMWICRKVINFVFRLVKILDHMNQLTHHTQRLSNICLYKVDHLGAIVLFDDIEVGKAQTQTLHALETLHCERPSWEEGGICPFFNLFLTEDAFVDVLDQEHVVEHWILVAHVLQDFFVRVLWIHNGEDLILVPWLNECGYTFGGDH